MNQSVLPVKEAHFIGFGDDLRTASPIPLVIGKEGVDWPTPPRAYHHIDFFSIYLVWQGHGTHLINGVPYGVSRGDVHVMLPGMTHQMTDCVDFVGDVVHFSQDIFDADTWDALREEPGFAALLGPIPGSTEQSESGWRWIHLTPDAFEKTAGMLDEMRQEWRRRTHCGAILTRSLFTRFIISLSRRYDAHAQQKTTAPSVARSGTVAAALRYFEAHFTEALHIEDVAAAVCLSPDRFTVVFSAQMGCTPRDYLRHLRVERAKYLLRKTDVSLLQVGAQSGFGQQKHFAQVFKATTGLSPRQFRQQHHTN